MIKPRNLFIIAALALSLVLAACSQPGPDARKPAPDGFITISIGLDGSSLSSQGADQELSTQGVPFDEDGDIAVEEIRVEVIGNYLAGEEEALRFDYDGGNGYTYNPAGDFTYVTLSANTDSTLRASHQADLVLPAWLGPFTFVSHGYAETGPDADTALPIAYDYQSQIAFDEVGTASPSVWINLKSVLGSAEIRPRLPVTMLTPGQSLDLMLYVYANGRPDLQVPLSDFALDGFDISGSAAVGSWSKLGMRMDVNRVCSNEVVVSAEIQGFTYSGTGVTEGTLTANLNNALECPDLTEGGAAADMQAPELSFERSYRNVEITATDNYGITAIQVFDGPDLVASTTPSDLSGEVVRIGYDWDLNDGTYTTLLTKIPTRGMTIVAFDASGNQAMISEGVTDHTLANVYVSPGGTGNGETATTPLGSIQEAVNKVALGGTIYLADGTYGFSGATPASTSYLVQITQKHGITIRSMSGNAEDVIINTSIVPAGFTGHGIAIQGSNNVTLQDLTVIGAGDKRAIHAQGNPSGSTAISGLRIINVTVTSDAPGGTGIGISFSVAQDSLLEDVTVTGYSGIGGNGIRLKAAKDITLRDTEVSGNFIGLGLLTVGGADDDAHYFLKGVHGITEETFTNSDNTVPLMTRIYDSYERAISSVNYGKYNYTLQCSVGDEDTYYFIGWPGYPGAEPHDTIQNEVCGGTVPILRTSP